MFPYSVLRRFALQIHLQLAEKVRKTMNAVVAVVVDQTDLTLFPCCWLDLRNSSRYEEHKIHQGLPKSPPVCAGAAEPNRFPEGFEPNRPPVGFMITSYYYNF